MKTKKFSQDLINSFQNERHDSVFAKVLIYSPVLDYAIRNFKQTTINEIRLKESSYIINGFRNKLSHCLDSKSTVNQKYDEDDYIELLKALNYIDGNKGKIKLQ